MSICTHRIPVLLLILALFAVSALAQSQAAGGAIEGVVRDPSGAVVPGADVTLVHKTSGARRTTQTGGHGNFSASLLRVGTWSVEARKEGFSAASGEVTLAVGQTVPLVLVLPVAGANQSVEVRAETAMVDPARTHVGTAISPVLMAELPLNGRNFKDLVLMSPATAPEGPFFQVSFHGIQSAFNNFTVDGADNNSAYYGTPRGKGDRAPFQFSQDAVREFQVVSADYSAEFGRSAGGLIQVVTRGGGDAYHGNAFWYLRHDSLNARNIREVTRPEDIRHQFGASVGGPIVPQRLFFFANVDQQIRRQPVTVLDPGVFIPVTDAQFASMARTTGLSVDVVRARYAQAQEWIAPQLSVDPRTGAYNGTFSRDLNQTVFLGRLDGNLAQGHEFSLMVNVQDFSGPNNYFTQTVQNILQSFNGEEKRCNVTATGQVSSVLTPVLLNEFRFQYAWDKVDTEANSDMPRMDIGNSPNWLRMGSHSNLPIDIRERRVQLVDNVGWSAGAHEFKAGVDVNFLRDDSHSPNTFAGMFKFNSLLEFAVGRYTRYSQNFGNPDNRQNTGDFALFLQDRIRLTPSLTLSAGLRWDYQRLDQPSVSNPLDSRTAHLDADPGNIAPRIGISWAAPGSRTAIRAGYGIYYARTALQITNAAMTLNGKTVSGGQLKITDSGAPNLGGDYHNTLAFRASGFSVPSSALSTQPDIYILGPARKNPMSHQASLEVEREVVPGTSVSATYLFCKTDYLPFNRYVNQLPGGGVVTYSLVDDDSGQVTNTWTSVQYGKGLANPAFRNVTICDSSAKAIHHGLTLAARSRIGGWATLMANYTWSRSIDTNPCGAETSTSRITDNQLQPSDRGLSDLHQAHLFNFSGVFAPRFESGNRIARAALDGWTLAPRLRLASGRPFSYSAFGASTADGRNNGNLNGDASDADRVLGRNSGIGPGWVGADLRLSRSFFLGESRRLEVVVECFNILNHPNFITPNNIPVFEVKNGTQLHYRASNPVLTGGKAFNSLSYVEATDPRQFQVALKFSF